MYNTFTSFLYFNFKLSFLLLCIFIFNFAKINILAEGYPNANVMINKNTNPGYFMVGSNVINAGFYDNYGIALDKNVVNWNNLKAGTDFKFHSNGKITYFDHDKFKFMVLDQNLTLIDSLACVNGILTDFHDIQFANNGNVLLIGVKYNVMDLSQLVNGGKIDAVVKGFVLQELNLDKELVWEWDTFDHFNVTDAISTIDLTANSVSFCHINSAIYDNDGNIIISSRHMDELSKINRQTGEILWRMGGSSCKNNYFTFIDDKDETGFIGFSHQHSPIRLKNGNLMLFDNGNAKGNKYSRAVEYEIDEVNKIVRKVWDFKLTPNYYASQMGSVEELNNGNIVISWWNRVTEVTKFKELVFDMDFVGDFTYRAHKVQFNMDAVENFINTKKNYNFNSGNKKTNVDLNIDTLSGSGIISVIRHKYAPKTSTFNINQIPTTLPIRYVIQKSDTISNFKANLIIDTRTIPQYLASDSVKIFYRNKENNGLFNLLNTTYKTNTIEARLPGAGEIVLAYIPKFTNPEINLPIQNSIGVAFNNSNISWKKVTNATNYKIQLSIDSLFTNLTKDTLVGNVDKISINLSSFKKYFLRIKAIGNGIESVWSNLRTFETVISKPLNSIPKNNAYYININDTLKWTSVIGAKKYFVQVSNDVSFANMNIVFEKTIDTNISIMSKLLNSQKYYWRVKSLRDTTGSEFSTIGIFNTKLYSILLSTPVNNEKYFKINNDLIWEKNSNLQQYQIEVSENQDFKNLIFTEKNIIDNRIKSKNLKYNTLYYWRIKAYDSNNGSDWSATFNFITELNTPNLEQPINKQENVDLNTKLKWQKVVGSSKYNLQLSNNINFDKVLIDTLIESKANSENSIEIGNLNLLTHYYWRVKAINDYGQTEFSEIFSFKTSNKLILNSPNLLLPENNFILTSNNVKFEWTKESLAKKYQLQISKINNFNEILLDTILEINSLSYNNLEKNIKYYWRIKSITNEISSDWSNIRNFIIIDENNILPPPLLISPTNEQISVSINTKIEWEKNEIFSDYKLMISADNNFETNNYELSDISETILDLSLVSNLKLNYNTKYYWKIQGYNSDKSSNWSEVWSFTTEKDSVTSVIDDRLFYENLNTKQNNIINLFPNPTTSKIIINLDEINTHKSDFGNIIIGNNIKNIEIYNLNGQLVYQNSLEKQLIGNLEIDVNHLEKGSYYILISNNDNKTINSSFIKK